MENEGLFSQIVPKYRISKKQYKFVVEVLRDIGSGVMVSFIFALFIDQQLGFFKFNVGFIMVSCLWYIGSRLSERT